jgi:transcriptional regulator with XRE-family HTH domain
VQISEHPLKIIRRFLRQDSNLRPFSTQRGFADLIDSSTSLIRAIEQGQTKMTQRVAKRIHGTLGVSLDWLQQNQDPDRSIPCSDGTTLTHSALLERIRNPMPANHFRSTHRDHPRRFDIDRLPQRVEQPEENLSKLMARMLARRTEKALLVSLSRGDMSVYENIFNILLDRNFRAGKIPADTDFKVEIT